MDDEGSDVDKPLFAAIKLYADTKVKIVPVKDIKNFVVQEKFTKPYFIKTMNPVTGCEEYEPGQILAVSNDVKELQENRIRYKFSTLRRSDALQQLAADFEHDSEEENESDVQPTKDIKEKKKGLSDKMKVKAAKTKESKILKSKIRNDQQQMNEAIMKEKIKCLESYNLNLYEEPLQSIDQFTTTDLKLEIDQQQRNISPNKEYKEIKNLLNDASALTTKKDEQKETTIENKVDNLEFQDNVKESTSRIIELENEIKNLKSIIEEKENVILKKKKKLIKKNEKIIKLANELDEIKNTLSELQSKEKNSLPLIETSEKTDNTVQVCNPLSTAEMDIDLQSHQDIADPFTMETHDFKLTPSKKSRASTPISPLQELINSPTSSNPGNAQCKKRLHQNISDQDEIQVQNDIDQCNIEIKKIKTEMKPKKRNSCDYDTDDYSKSDTEKKELVNFTSWKKTVENKTVKMFHLCYGISIYYSEWNALKNKEESKFVRSLAEAIWSSHELKNRAIDITKVCSKLPDRSPVRPCTPKKMAALRKTYWHYLTLKKKVTIEILQNMPIKEKEQLLNKWRVYLKAKINSLRGGKCEKKDQD